MSKGTDADREDLEQLIANWNAAVNTGDVDGIIDLVTSDFEMIPPDEDPVHGMEAHQFLRGFFDFDLDLDGKTLELIISGDLALRRYSYRLSLAPKGGGESQQMSGQGINVMVRHPSGRWKYSKDMYNEP